MITLVGKPKDDCPKRRATGFELQQHMKDDVVHLRICSCVRFEVVPRAGV
jgi:hypothetical protein